MNIGDVGMVKRKYGIKAAGYKELKKYMSGKRLTRKEAMLAKCYDCCGGYIDGRIDCGCKGCPMYDYMPYKGKKSQKD